MHLARFPRLRLGHFPTPLEPMPRLSRLLGGPTLYVKRDDCTGLASGGNKVRKLEFLMAEALAQEADTILTQGAVQSNHVRQTVAAAARLGLACEVFLENRTGSQAPAYQHSGNVMLDRLMGTHPTQYPAGTDMQAVMDQRADVLRAEGHTPYVIPGGGSNPVGALGYVNAAMELLTQANEQGLRIDHIVQATGSGGTHAGLLVGLRGCHAPLPVLGISVRAPKAKQEANVLALAEETAAFMGMPGVVQAQDVVANSDYVGDGYGLPTEGMVEAVRRTAQQEGLLLDPVYTGKGMAGLIDLIRRGYFDPGQNVVFLHTGGSAGLFGYIDTFS